METPARTDAEAEEWPPAAPAPAGVGPRPLNMHERGLVLSIKFFTVGAVLWAALFLWMLLHRDWQLIGLILLFGGEAAGFAGVALYGWRLARDVRAKRRLP